MDSCCPFISSWFSQGSLRSLDPPSVGVVESQSLGLALCLEWMDVVATSILEWEPMNGWTEKNCDSLLSSFYPQDFEDLWNRGGGASGRLFWWSMAGSLGGGFRVSSECHGGEFSWEISGRWMEDLQEMFGVFRWFDEREKMMWTSNRMGYSPPLWTSWSKGATHEDLVGKHKCLVHGPQGPRGKALFRRWAFFIQLWKNEEPYKDHQTRISLKIYGLMVWLIWLSGNIWFDNVWYISLFLW